MLKAVIRRLERELRGKTHSAVAVNIGEPNTHTKVVSVMTDEERNNELTDEELERQEGEPLPERTQMSLMHPGPGPLPVVDFPIDHPSDT
jgi:hypothetical protein